MNPTPSAVPRRSWRRRLPMAVLLAAGLALLGACGSSDGDDAPGSATVGGPEQTQTVEFAAPGGATIAVPAGALAAPVTLRVAADSTGAPTLPAGSSAAGAVHALTPHGSVFGAPVRVRLPFDPSALPADADPVVLRAEPGGTWEVLEPVARGSDSVEIETWRFSFFVVVQRPGWPFLANPLPAIQTRVVQPAASHWSTATATTPATLTLTSPADVVVEVDLVNPPACSSGWTVQFGTLDFDETRVPGQQTARTSDSSRREAMFQTQPLGNHRYRLTLPWSYLEPLNNRVDLPIAGFAGATRSEFTWLGAPQARCAASAAPFGAAPAAAERNRWIFVRTGARRVGIGAQPADAAVLVGQPASFEVRLIGSGAGPVDSRVRVEWLRAAPGSLVFVPLGSTFSLDQTGDTHRLTLPAGTLEHGARYRAVACLLDDITGLSPCVESAAATLSVTASGTAPEFTLEPRSMIVVGGETASLSVQVRGLPQPSLQWQVRSTPEGVWADVTAGSGATGTSYVTEVLTLAATGRQYRVLASNAAGSTASTPATVSVSGQAVAPVITADLSAIRTLRGGDATMAVAVRGSEPLSYEWRVGGNVVLGQNAPVLNLQSLQVGSTVSVTVSNGAGSVTSREVAITLLEGAAPPPPLGIVRQPVATTVTVGNTATLAVQVDGGGNIGYQWQRNGVDISAATEPVFSLASAQPADAGNYRLIVSRGAETLTSSEVALAVNAAGPQPEPLNITFQPTGLSLNPGQTALFAVAGTGAGPLRYQWLREGVPISGATAPVLRIDAVAAGDAGNYTVQVTDTTGTAVSNAAGLVVLPAPGAPQFTSFVMPFGSVVGDTPRITITVAASPQAQCLWLRNGAVIPGASDCSGHTLPALTLTDNGSVFTAVAYNAGGAAVSDAFVLGVRQPAAPAILSHPADASTTEGGVAVFTATYSGEPPPERRWFVNGVELPVAFLVPFSAGNCSGGYDVTGASLRLLQLTAGCDGATVAFTATNTLGSATSNTATLTVTPSVPAGALTATQVVAGHEWSLVLRPDRTVWGWGGLHKLDGTVVVSNLAPGDQARRPVQMYPAVLTDVRQIAGWYDGFWALTGEPGSAGSRVLHWGNARSANDGRGADGLGNPGPVPSFRVNASPVPMLERRTVNGSLQSVPVDRVCSVAATSDRALLIRALDGFGIPTDCAAGSAKTVWVAGTLTTFGTGAVGVVLPVQGLPAGIPARLITAQHSAQSSLGPAMVLMEDSSLHGWGMNIGNQFGLPLPANTGTVGSDVAPQSLPGGWGAARVAAFSYVGLIVGRSDGSAMVSGRNDGSELGLGPQPSGTVNNGPLPLLAAAGVPLDGVDALASAQVQVSLALRQGRILAWGAANQPLQGGSTSAITYPRLLPASGDGWRALSAGHAHALAIAANGVAYTWGNGLRGALGNGQDSGNTLAPTMLTVP